MKFFLDTANLEEIKKVKDMGLLDGVTTNPTLIAKEGVDFKKRVSDICQLCEGPVSVEAVAREGENIVKEARIISTFAENIVVKVPATTEGIKAVKILSEEDIKTNVTLVFSSTQALIAAKAGATFVSPFIGRLDDISYDGMQLISDMVQIYSNYDFQTEIIGASIRHPVHIVQLALLGVDIATLPFSVLQQLFHHPLTDIGIQKFLQDWEKVPNRNIK